MSSLKKFVLVSSVVVAVLGALQIGAGAAILPLASWSLDGAAPGGTAVDSVGTNNLTYHAGGTIAPAPGVWGVPNTAASFGGNNTGGSYASGTIPTGGLLYPLCTAGSSVEAFFKADSFNTGTNAEECIYGEGTSTGISVGLVIKGTTLDFEVLKPGVWWGEAQLSAVTLSTGTWYYAAGTCVYNSGTNLTTVSTYLYNTSGSLLGSISATGDTSYPSYTGTPTGATPTIAYIGAERTDRFDIQEFPGTIDNVKLYSGLLDAATMSQHASTITDTPEPSTLALLAAGLIGLLCYAWRKRK